MLSMVIAMLGIEEVASHVTSPLNLDGRAAHTEDGTGTGPIVLPDRSEPDRGPASSTRTVDTGEQGPEPR